jgi:hypothetical protein
MEYTEEQKAKILDLNKRSADLYKGVDININLVIKDGARLEWTEDVKLTEIGNCDNCHAFWEKVSKQYEKQMKPLRKEFQAKIDAVIKEADELAKEVGEDSDEFFSNNICA